MTDNEIIKALECCIKIANFEDCKKCLYYAKAGCERICKENVLDLINRQKAEIERFKQEHIHIDNFARDICKERMLKGKAVADFEDLQDYIRKEKAEAVKEFAENVTYCKDCKNYELMTSNNQHFCNKYGGYVTETDCCSRGTPCKRNGG